MSLNSLNHRAFIFQNLNAQKKCSNFKNVYFNVTQNSPTTHNLFYFHRKIFGQNIGRSPDQAPVEAEHENGQINKKSKHDVFSSDFMWKTFPLEPMKYVYLRHLYVQFNCLIFSLGIFQSRSQLHCGASCHTVQNCRITFNSRKA